MKLYFYSLNDFGYGSTLTGISRRVYEVIEKPKTYYPAYGKSFPSCMSYIKKEDIGGRLIGYNRKMIALTEPDFEYAKDIFKEYAELKVKHARESLKCAEENLKIIMESEEK